jgi:hypothetical protein
MKFLVFILALAINAQPLQAGLCDMDMEENQETPQQVDGGAEAGHDCCDEGDADNQQEQGCEGKTHCSPCFVSAPLLPATARLQLDWSPQHTESALLSLALSSHSSPPFRPPIS